MSTEKFDIPKKDFPLGRRLKIYLDAKEMKAADLARKTGISKATISEAINEISDLKGRKIELIVRHTDLNPVWFVTGEGEMTRADIPIDEKDTELADLLGKAREVLISNHPAKDALKSNIRCFLETIRMSESIQKLEAEVKKLKNRNQSSHGGTGREEAM